MKGFKLDMKNKLKKFIVIVIISISIVVIVVITKDPYYIELPREIKNIVDTRGSK